MPTLGLQMGHVDRTTGATGTTGEQEYARRASDAVVKELADRGGKASHGWTIRVLNADEVMSRYADLDAFVAVHCDGSIYESARGASVGYRTTSGRNFGDAVMDAYESLGWNGGFRNDNYTEAMRLHYGVRKAVEMGCYKAIIVEAGFLTNPDNRALLVAPDGASRLAKAICNALKIADTSTSPVQTEPAPEFPEEDMLVLYVGTRATVVHPSGLFRVAFQKDDAVWQYYASKGAYFNGLTTAAMNELEALPIPVLDGVPG